MPPDFSKMPTPGTKDDSQNDIKIDQVIFQSDDNSIKIEKEATSSSLEEEILKKIN